MLGGRIKYWSKSALSIYKYLETMSMGIDKAVKDIVSGSNSALLQKSQSTYCQASRIICYTYTSIHYCTSYIRGIFTI